MPAEQSTTPPSVDKDKVYWTILGPGTKADYVKCRCVCGTEREVRKSAIAAGMSKSCNCMKATLVGNARRTHGRSHTPEHNVWMTMLARCSNPNHESYEFYGACGITVCERWQGENGFVNFYADMGPRPKGNYSIERRNNDGNYEPSNCYWGTPAQQTRNRSSNVWIEFRGRTLCLSDRAKELGMHPVALKYRIKKWGVEKAFTTPKATGAHRQGRPKKNG